MQMRINGKTHRIEATPDTPLLYVLRNELGLNGARFGCGLGQCGACTVLVDGSPARSCITPVSTLKDADVTTLEGLGDDSAPHALQTAFIDHQAMQCGFCANGMIMTAAALMSRRSTFDDDALRRALSGNLCRCGAHPRILAAVKQAMAQQHDN